MGLAVAPVREGKLLEPEAFNALPDQVQQRYKEDMERFGDDLPAPWLWIRIDHDDADFDRRVLTFEDVGGGWTARLPRLATLLAAPEA